MRKKLENYFIKNGSARHDAEPMSWFIVIGIICFILWRTGVGIADANNPQECRIYSINDVIISPFYALGCNLAKKRFDVKLN